MHDDAAARTQEEFMKAVEGYMLTRLQVGDRVLERALSVGAARREHITLCGDGISLPVAAIVPTDLGQVRRYLAEECVRAGFRVHTELLGDKLFWDCDPLDAPWGPDRPWEPCDLVHEIALANALAA